jgi:predicted nucleotidyltransferase
MLEEDFQQWLQRLGNKYPQVTNVALVGSRADDCARVDSDWDVVICLEDSIYDIEEHKSKQSAYTYTTSELKDKEQNIEQLISWDEEIGSDSPALDIFFLRPGGTLSRWERSSFLEELKAKYPGDKGIQMLLDGVPAGDFDRLYKSLKYAKVVYEVRP